MKHTISARLTVRDGTPSPGCKTAGTDKENRMRVRYAVLCLVILPVLIFPIAKAADAPSTPSATLTATPSPDPLLEILVSKGILNPDEARSLKGTASQQKTELVQSLCQKGVLTASDCEQLTSASAQVAGTPMLPAQTSAPAEPQTSNPAPPKVIPARQRSFERCRSARIWRKTGR